MIDTPELLVSREGAIGRIRLNRPEALNSLTLTMVRGFTRALADFAGDPEIVAVLVTGEGARGLCAGGDIRRLYKLRDGDRNPYRDFWREEYQLNAMIARFPKPYVVIMDGLVMGGGVGISAHGSCRIVTERTRLAMPEAAIGFVPDVGGTWLLARAGGAGIHMGLSGAAVSGADAIHAGFADVFIHSDRLADFCARLTRIARAQDARAIADGFALEPEAGILARNGATLERLTVAACVKDVIVALASDGSDFARAAAAAIARNSPTSLEVTFALLTRARMAKGLEECLTAEYCAACSLLDSHDLYEGIRAAIVDKDRAPRWRPASLADVEQEAVRKILGGDGSAGPVFPRAA